VCGAAGTVDALATLSHTFHSHSLIIRCTDHALKHFISIFYFHIFIWLQNLVWSLCSDVF
jgi:hypothetical protein